MKKYWTSLGLILLGIVLWGGFNTAMEATNTLEFCISCHEMESTVYQEYKQSVHYRNPSGVQATCPDCHVPKDWIPKFIRKIQASKEVYHWLRGTIDTPEKFEARRLQLAEHVWQSMKDTDSRECRNCHHFDAMDLEGQARFAARIHRQAMVEQKTCIDCHQGISHRLPRELTVQPEQKLVFDSEDAEDIMDICAACHGIYGQGTPDGEYPRLAGLDANYLAKQLEAFKNRTRINIPMMPFANDRELPPEDVKTITAYFASIDLPTRLEPVEVDEADLSFNALARLEESKKVLNIPHYQPGNSAAGARLYRKECAGCHGDQGLGDRARTIPRLTGQHSLYLLRQIKKFQKGERIHDHPEDQHIFQQFSQSEIDDILAWLSDQDDEL